MNCKNCNTMLRTGAKFCHVCGTRVEFAEERPEESGAERTCPGCGQALKPGANFCAKCGEENEAKDRARAEAVRIAKGMARRLFEQDIAAPTGGGPVRVRLGEAGNKELAALISGILK